MDIRFGLTFTALEWSLLGLCVASAVAFVAIYVARIRRVRRAVAPQILSTGLPRASVIVYALDDAEALASLLPRLLAQDYPEQFEVIVAADGQSEATRRVVDALRLQHNNIYMTEVPDEARNLSRRKLALTLGVKAARHEALVLTTAQALIATDQWLRLMAAHFARPGIEVVLGYAVPEPAGALSRTAAFDWARDAVTWLAPALRGHAWRGTGWNLAYRRQTFFDNKGFSRTLNLIDGDDDIFVSELATPANVAVEIRPEAIVGVDLGANARRAARDLADRHAFTGRNLAHGSRRAIAAGPWLLLTSIGAGTASAWLAWPDLTPACTALVVVIAATVLGSAAWGKLMRATGMRRLALTLPWMMLTAPARGAWSSLRRHWSRQRHYTWQ